MDCRQRVKGCRIAPGHFSSWQMLVLQKIEFVSDRYKFNQLLRTTSLAR
jgi:hypothetical protein